MTSLLGRSCSISAKRWLFLSAVLLAGCGDDDGPVGDAGIEDVGTGDALTDVAVDTRNDTADAQPQGPREAAIAFGSLTRLRTQNEAFLSVAVDMAQLVGGEFWADDGTMTTVGGMRVPPYDFDRPRLRALASALAPAIFRIGGSDADRVYYDFSDEPLEEAPEGFEWVLTRDRFDAVFEFAEATGMEVMFTISAGRGVRNEANEWQSDQAEVLLDHAAAEGHEVTLWELGNEPNAFGFIDGFSVDHDTFAADVARFRETVRERFPDARIGGVSPAYWPLVGEPSGFLRRFSIAGGVDALDIVTWHYYPQQSLRCPGASLRAEEETLLNASALDEVLRWSEEIERFSEGKPIWLGETGHAQCGGEPGLSNAYASTLWWLDQLGTLAHRGQEVVVRQTLSGGDYGIIDETTLNPNPDYWGTWMWRQLMGADVLELERSDEDEELRAFAHCHPDRTGEATILLLNIGESETTIELDATADLFRMEAENLRSREVEVNGVTLEDDEGVLPAITPMPGQQEVVLAPRSIAFLVAPSAACE